jgi:hypothetical protein
MKVFDAKNQEDARGECHFECRRVGKTRKRARMDENERKNPTMLNRLDHKAKRRRPVSIGVSRNARKDSLSLRQFSEPMKLPVFPATVAVLIRAVSSDRRN